MAKFSSIAKGHTARRLVTIPLLSGDDLVCDVVPLLVDQESRILSEARAYAKAKGIDDPKDGQPLYELGKWVHTLVHACVDPDSPVDNPAPYFDGGVAQIIDPAKGLDRDRVALLYKYWEAWQDECSPPPRSMTSAEYYAHVIGCAESEEGAMLPFEPLRPAIQRNFVRTMARQVIELLQLKSHFGSPSADESPSSTTSVPPTPPPDETH